MVPGGGDFDGVVTTGERGDVDGAAAGLGVSEHHIPPVVRDGYIVGHVGIIHNGDSAGFAVVEHIGHVGRDARLGVGIVSRLQDNMIVSCKQIEKQSKK